MNKTKIEYVDFTWNPVTGCSYGCEYCYAREMHYRFFSPRGWAPVSFDVPEFWPRRLEQPLKRKKPAIIFLGSMTDLYAPEVQPEWIEQIEKVIKATPQHFYITLTKRREGILQNHFPSLSNHWKGVTTEGEEVFIMPPILNIEPFLKPPTVLFIHDIQLFKWVIIGAQTRNGKTIKPIPPEWIEPIIKRCRDTDIPLFIKDNVSWPEKIQEWPKIIIERKKHD